MNYVKSMVLVSMGIFTGCSIESKDSSTCNQTTVNKKTDNCSAPTATMDPKTSASGDHGICSFKPGLGCLKANITNADMRVGDFSYAYGIIDFQKRFPSDLAAAFPDLFIDAAHLQFTRTVTTNNFYSGFDSTAEGSSTTYSPVQTGLGNLQINDMEPGTYTLLFSKSLDISAISSLGKILKHVCAIMVTRIDTLIAADETSAPTRPINEFELQIYDGSCSGSKTTYQSSTSIIPAAGSGTPVSAGPQTVAPASTGNAP